MNKKFLSLVFISFCITTMLFGGVKEEDKYLLGSTPRFVGYASNRIVVKFNSSVLTSIDKSRLDAGLVGINSIDQLNQKYSVEQVKVMFPDARPTNYKDKIVDLSGWHKIKFSSAQKDVESVVREYLALPYIEKAEPVGIHTIDKMPDDGCLEQRPRFLGSCQWFLYSGPRKDVDINAPEAWDIETGNDKIIVGMMDTGVQYYHFDIGGPDGSYEDQRNIDKGNIWLNMDEKYGTEGIDDDGNGFIDDWVGWDFVDGVTEISGYQAWEGEDAEDQDNNPHDFNGHGTHCAGNVSTINNNTYHPDFTGYNSLAGGWWDGEKANGVKVMCIRIGWSATPVDNPGGEYGLVAMDFAAEGFYYAADNGAKIVNCSWGSSNSGGLAEAIDYFVSKGGLIFKAAGNSDNEDADYMCSRDDIIAVAATDDEDCKASFSSYGDWVDISAPGDDINNIYYNHDYPEYNTAAGLFSGTSMASPIAASVGALIWSHWPHWSANQVKQRLFDSADDGFYNNSCNSGYQGKLGIGRVDAFAAVDYNEQPGDPPVANFEGSPLSGDAPLTVNFTDLTTNNPTSWNWDFGDGGISTAQNPAHEYTAEGTYTVQLTATNSSGSDTETKTDYITVTICPAPVADFEGSPTSGEAPLTVNFTDNSSNDPTSWSWDFGDGATSTDQNPSHEYSTEGTYTVQLTATNSCGSDTETKTDYITVSSCPAPAADFEGSPTSGEAPLTVNFTDNSSNDPTSWSWDFGDGATSTNQNPSHEYTTEGTYTVQLTATNSCGSDTETKTDYITVSSCPAPVADFEGTPPSGEAPLTVDFTDISSNDPTSWNWDFGDGGTSTDQNPSHEYTAEGTYTIQLTATNSCGSDTETKTDYITVTTSSPNTMHVNAIEVTKEKWYILYRGQARIQIVDAADSPVADVTVTGDWSGGSSQTSEGTTGSDGWVTVYTNWRWGDADFTFCVTDVYKSGWTYDSDANVSDCGSTTDGSSQTTALKKANINLESLDKEIADKLAYSNPNPFNSTTSINFYLPVADHVTVEIFNIMGEKIITLLDREAAAGLNSVTWNGINKFGHPVGSGNYFFKIKLSNGQFLMRKMLLLK